MAHPPLADAICAETLAALDAAGGIQTAAAKALGISRETFVSRLRTARARNLEAAPVPETLPPSDLTFAERLDFIKRRNRVRIDHARAQRWQTIQIPVTGPYGLCFFGDPHLDDDFCDVEGFERDALTCAKTPALYGVNGGDSINNWVGGLARLYAEQSQSAADGWEMVEWALLHLGVKWALWLIGNHDAWNGGGRLFDKMNAEKILMRDWGAKVVLRSPDDAEVKLWASHNFKGSSIYNELHGLKRASMIDEEADIYAGFHIHTYATAQGEIPDTGRRYTLIRARGYKEVDSHAIRHQFGTQRDGQSVVAVIEPRVGMQPRVKAFENVAEGADYLTHLRSRRLQDTSGETI